MFQYTIYGISRSKFKVRAEDIGRSFRSILYFYYGIIEIYIFESDRIYMDIMIRDIERKDLGSVAIIWRDVLGYPSITEESIAETYEKMKDG